MQRPPLCRSMLPNWMKNFMTLFGFIASLFGATTPAAETKLVDPKSILFSTCTLNDALPAYTSNASPDRKLLQIHEDDWRQFEGVSTRFADAINQELNAIRKIHETASVKSKAGDREFTAFRSLHVRKLITDPIPPGLKLSSIAALAENRDEYAGLSLSGSPPVVGGYALSIDGLILFGQADSDRVLSLCLIGKGAPKVAAEKAGKLVSLFQENHLVFVHWPTVTKIEPSELLSSTRDGTVAKPGDFRTQAREAFELELKKHGLAFTIDRESGRYRLNIEDFDTLVSIENLQRDVEGDHDLSRVIRFVDTVVASMSHREKSIDVTQLFWCLEPNDYVDKADYRAAISDRVDRVLVLLSDDRMRITWVSAAMLAKAALSLDEAESKAFENLSREMKNAKIEFSEMDGVRLGYLNTKLPFKASLILAPNLKPCVEATLGWPLMAAAPDRDFLYLWAARHDKFVNRVGGVVVDQHAKASYPLSTEIYSITDDKIRAIGEFPSRAKEKK